MKLRIAKKILQGRSSAELTQGRVFRVRQAAAGTKYHHLAKCVLYGYLYGGSAKTLLKIIRENT